MSENPPPVEGQSNVPPVQAYAAYPRAMSTPNYGSPDKLEALMEGYYGLNWVFLALVLCGALTLIVAFLTQDSSMALPLIILTAVVGIAFVGWVGYKYIKKIGFGLGWQPSAAIWVTIGLLLGSCIVSPILVFIVLQLMAMGEIKNYGIKGGFFGIRKKDIKARLAQLRQQSGDLSAPPQG